MPKFPQKRSVNVAAAKNRLHDLSHAHITTTDFGRLKTIESRYMVPGDEFNCNVVNETRVLSNMPCPTYGRFDLVYRGFFVPISHIWNHFYDFIKNQQSPIDGVLTTITEPPYTTCEKLSSLFSDSYFGLSVEVNNPSDDSEYDFKFNNKFYAFNKKGRICYDFLLSNGLNFNFSLDTNKHISVLPLVAFWKFYYDWIVPSRFIHNHQYNIYNFISKINNSSGYLVNGSELFNYLVYEPLCYYQSDLFNTLTEDPFQESSNLNSDVVIEQPGGALDTSLVEASQDPDASPLSPYAHLDSNNLVFNMYTLETLGKLQDMLNRNMIAGTKVQDWLLSEFGLRPSDDALHLSTYLGSKQHTLSISDVISTADTIGTNGVGLGSYGGYVKNQFNFDFSYKSKEHGYFFITYELIPRTNYYQGLIPEFNMQKRLDFFQPEFDNQQGSPFTFGDLFFAGKGDQQHESVNEPFGFGLQYSRFKFATDRISGDFRNRFGKNLRSWFLVRDMEKYARISSDVDFIDEEFCLVKTKYQDWNYIFADTNEESLDHFLSVFYFNMPCKRPMLSIAEAFEPTYKNNGTDINISFNGSVQS